MTATPAVPALLADGLQVRLGRTQVLRGVGLRVERGDLYGLLGRNGAGKTTSMRCLLGLLPADAGRCEVLGVPSARLSDVAQPIGIALDPPGLDETLTVRENLDLARIRGGLRGGRSAADALALVGMTRRQHHRADRLSHGQARRAAVARALLGAPRLLVLDEPLSGLDPEGVEELLDLFRRLAREEGVTVILSSHHLRELQEVCTRVGIIEEGRVVVEGATAELLAAERVRLHCREPARAAALLRQGGLSEVEDLGGGWVRGRLAGCDAEALLAALVSGGVGLDEFRRERDSLVDLFRRAVGREPE